MPSTWNLELGSWNSYDLSGEADDLVELLAELAGDGPEHAGAARVELVVQQHHRVPVEPHVGAVVAAGGLLRPDDNRLDHVPGLHVPARDGLLDAGDDDVPQPRIPAPRAAQHLDAHALLGAGIVGHIDVRIHLDHVSPSPAGPECGSHTVGVSATWTLAGALVTTRISRQHFCLDSGRVSMISTVSPTWASFFSSWT